MVQLEEIGDKEGLEAWLKTRSFGDVVSIVSRAALRVLPLWVVAVRRKGAETKGFAELQVLRAILVGRVAVHALPRMVEYAPIAADAADLASNLISEEDPSGASAAYSAIAIADAISDSDFSAALSAMSYATEAVQHLYERDTGYSAETTFELSRDVWVLDRTNNRVLGPLWGASSPDWFSITDKKMLDFWAADPPSSWDFWRRWWLSERDGKPMNPEMLLAIVQRIADETWKDPDAVAAEIAKIEREFKGKKENATPPDPDPVGGTAEWESLPAGSPSQIRKTAAAMVQNRLDLPPVIETILGYIDLEIERLQHRNYRDEDDAEEAKRQIAGLMTIRSAVSRLQVLVPSEEQMPQSEAEEAEKLSRLILRRLKEWPRRAPGDCPDNMSDLVDNSYRAALVGGCAFMAPMIGVAPDKALIAGAVVFGGKKIVDTAKAAKEFVTRKDGG